ncbi:PIN domain-containing protein [Pyrofollis japonicus]|uniref:PIN domain-containing protein n=1 Tax=Pyrofollis japonicus TaxID=3060460 RepID=UPI00295C1CEA|nr:PIN domain-containing protein [Pyrofollis japonicus]BEP17882.1 PIN domain-containing protein [Pyrofollis japonicus]
MSTRRYEAVVDTSFLRALLLEDEPGHEEAQRIANCVERFIVPSIVLHELVWSTRRSHGPARAQSLAAYVLGDEMFRYEPVGVGDVWFALRDPRRYEDLLVLSVAIRLGKPLASFDKDLVKLARRHGVLPATCQ